MTVTEVHLEKVKKYLFQLDLLMDCSERYESRGAAEYTVFSQPGMRYAIAKALVYSLMQDEYFSACQESDREYITAKILEDVKGRMLEDIVLLETTKALTNESDVFRFKFDGGGEYDMVVYDRREDSCRLYEIRHSDKIVERQAKYLRDEEKNAIVSKRFGRIAGKYVLYRGASRVVGEIQYENVEEYLKRLR